MGGFSKEIGRFFKERRLDAGFSIEQITQQLELTPADLLTEFEAGLAELPLFHIYALSNLLGMSSDEVLERIYTLVAENDLAPPLSK